MTSIRNNETGQEAGASTADRLLDAARASILSVGWKRTTLTDVARRAGVSRMTVYRTYPDMPTLFGDLMTREWARVVADVVASEDDTAAWPDRVAARLVGTTAALRENDLFRRIVDVDPELLLPYLLDRRGRSQDAVLDLLAERLRDAQAEGGVRAGDPVLLARALLLTAHGFTLSHATMADDEVSAADLDAQLGELVRRYLTP
jgi:AcrR family transcriptional regulator